MKKLLLMCCFILGIAAAGHAQGGMRMSAEDRAKQMQASLKLTDDQTAKVTAVLKMQATKMDSIRTAANGDRDAMRSAMAPLRQSTTDQLKAILTPDQMTAYEKMQADMRARMQQGGGGGNN